MTDPLKKALAQADVNDPSSLDNLAKVLARRNHQSNLFVPVMIAGQGQTNTEVDLGGAPFNPMWWGDPNVSVIFGVVGWVTDGVGVLRANIFNTTLDDDVGEILTTESPTPVVLETKPIPILDHPSFIRPNTMVYQVRLCFEEVVRNSYYRAFIGSAWLRITDE